MPVTPSVFSSPLVERTRGARRVAVVGAGLAGLACARELTERGLAVTLFDKGRAPGGRATSRQAEGGRVFDHGAQFFTARGDWLSGHLPAWEREGVVAQWSPRLSKAVEGRRRAAETWWVGAPRMGALAAHLARGLDVRLGHIVSAIARSEGAWSITFAGTDLVQHADALVIAVPAPQCAALLTPDSDLFRGVTAVEQTPCWAVMVAVRTAGPTEADLFEDRRGVGRRLA